MASSFTTAVSMKNTTTNIYTDALMKCTTVLSGWLDFINKITCYRAKQKTDDKVCNLIDVYDKHYDESQNKGNKVNIKIPNLENYKHTFMTVSFVN